MGDFARSIEALRLTVSRVLRFVRSVAFQSWLYLALIAFEFRIGWMEQ
jgi:hypothetical protein